MDLSPSPVPGQEYEELRRAAEEARGLAGAAEGAGGGADGNGVKAGEEAGRLGERKRKGEEPGLVMLVLCVSVTLAILAVILRTTS